MHGTATPQATRRDDERQDASRNGGSARHASAARVPPNAQVEDARARTRRAIAICQVFVSPVLRADSLPRPATTSSRPCVALALVVASCVFLVVAAVLASAWALGGAVVCAVIAAPLAAYTD